MPFQYALDHPIASPILTHFAGRRGQTPDHLTQSAARLHQILWSQQILGTAPYSAGPPAVSFTESRIEDLEYLLGRGYFAPWGVVVYRDDAFTAGGAPVWSVRTDVLASVPEPLRVWTARLEPGQSEWLHEREWRIPAAQVSLGQPLRLVAIIIGGQNWRPGYPTHDLNPWTGRPSYVDRVPPVVAAIQRWYWDAAQRRLLALPAWQDEFHDV